MDIDWSLILGLGLVNWIATTILVDSTLTEALRTKPIVKWQANASFCMASEYAMDGTGRAKWTKHCVLARFWAKVHQLVNCHLCLGTWVAFIQAAFFIRGPWYVWISYALLIKAVGHLILEVRSKVAA